MSGDPGRSRRCSRNRYPRLWSSLRTRISGAVSLPRIAAMLRLRCGVTARGRGGVGSLTLEKSPEEAGAGPPVVALRGLLGIVGGKHLDLPGLCRCLLPRGARP
jgi:hypothetical protein